MNVCCNKCEDNVVWANNRFFLAQDPYETPLAFCPFCGRPFGGDAADAKVRVCFDVDGVLAKNDPRVPYREREPYSFVREQLTKLRDMGVTIVIQTARHMRKTGGNQASARDCGLAELVDWLDKHNLPYDEVYMGKASARLYADDRGVRVDSNNGVNDWNNLEREVEGLL